MRVAAWFGPSAPYGGDSAEARSGDGSFDGAFSDSFEGALDGEAAPAYHGPRYRVMQTLREEPVEPAHAPRDLDRLVALQSADGSWDLTPEFAELIGRSLDDLEAELRGAPGGRVARRVWQPRWPWSGSNGRRRPSAPSGRCWRRRRGAGSITKKEGDEIKGDTALSPRTGNREVSPLSSRLESYFFPMNTFFSTMPPRVET